MTLHDLAADWSWMDDEGVIGFRFKKGGRVVWHYASYTGSSIRISRWKSGEPPQQSYESDVDREVEIVKEKP